MRKANSEKAIEKIKDGGYALEEAPGANESPRRRGTHGLRDLSPPVAEGPATEPSTQKTIDLTDRTKELVRLAREQGHLTYEDVNDALSEGPVTPDDLDRILTELRSL